MLDNGTLYLVQIRLTQWQAFKLIEGVQAATELPELDLSELVLLERKLVERFAIAGINTDEILKRITGDEQ